MYGERFSVWFLFFSLFFLMGLRTLTGTRREIILPRPGESPLKKDPWISEFPPFKDFYICHSTDLRALSDFFILERLEFMSLLILGSFPVPTILGMLLGKIVLLHDVGVIE